MVYACFQVAGATASMYIYICNHILTHCRCRICEGDSEGRPDGWGHSDWRD